MKFNYSKLLGRIRERGFTQASLAAAIGISKCTLSAKLNNQNYFLSSEIVSICEILNILAKDIPSYFFTQQVQKN